MHVRLQTWFPFEIQVYINGREYLSKQMDKQGIPYQRYDNSFTSIADIPKAQEIVNAFSGRDLNNSIKMYDKSSILRVETTINNPYEFKIFKESGSQKQKKWVPMGKSIANIYWYSQVSEAANKRYLDALSLAQPRSHRRAVA